MNNHKKFEILLQGYLDNVLDPKEKELFQRHLDTCKRCKKKLKERETLLETFRLTKKEIQCPDYLTDKILQKTTKKQHGEIISSHTIRWRYLAVGAAAILIVVSTVMFNIENSRNIFITKNRKGIRKEKLSTEETNITKSEEKILEGDESEVTAGKKHITEKPLKLTQPLKPAAPAPKSTLPGEDKKDFNILSKNIVTEETKKEESLQEKEIFMPSIDARAAAPSKTSKRKAIEPNTAGLDYETEKASADIAASREALITVGSLEGEFEETRLIFPEEGSVVGNDFEIVIILKNPAEKIEIRLDGEQITNYTKTNNSNIIFIGSDSLPFMEEGLHFLSVSTTKEKSLTFYKEG